MLTKRELARMIDHTALKPETRKSDIERLCDEAIEFGFATVCVAPIWVSVAAERLRGGGPRVCAVVGFPHGNTLPSVKAFETAAALDAGARELDMVLPVGRLKDGDAKSVLDDVGSVVAQARRFPEALVKVILETSLLTREEKLLACRLAEEAGADFVKTSTGFGPGGATVDDVRLLSGAVRGRLGVKAAGGIRRLDFVRELLEAGATRLGSSSSVALVNELPA